MGNQAFASGLSWAVIWVTEAHSCRQAKLGPCRLTSEYISRIYSLELSHLSNVMGLASARLPSHFAACGC